MAKSGNSMNDAALESAAGGAYATLEAKESKEFDLFKDDGTYLGTYKKDDDGIKQAKTTLGFYGNKNGDFRVMKASDVANKNAKTANDLFKSIKW